MKKIAIPAIAFAIAVMSIGAASAADVKKGKRVFAKCKACHVVNKEKNKATGDAEDAVSKTTGEVIGKLKTTAALDSSVTGEPLEMFDQSLASIGAAMDKNLDDAQKGHFDDVLDKVVDPGKGPLTADQMMCSTAVTLISLHGMKRKYKTEAALTTAFTNLEAAAGKSAFKKLFGKGILPIFKISNAQALAVLSKFGITMSAGDFFGGGDASQFADVMKSIGEPGVPNMSVIAQTLQDNNVVQYNVPAVVYAINGLILNGTTPKNLASLVHAIDDRDMIRLAALFLGKTPDQIKPIEIRAVPPGAKEVEILKDTA